MLQITFEKPKGTRITVNNTAGNKALAEQHGWMQVEVSGAGVVAIRTEEELRAISEADGIEGLRLIAETHGVKGASKDALIAAILEAQGAE